MPCRIKTVQAREGRGRVEDKVQAEDRAPDKVQAEAGEEEWAKPVAAAVAVDHLRALQVTVCAPNADSRLRIRSDFPAAGRTVRNAEQK